MSPKPPRDDNPPPEEAPTVIHNGSDPADQQTVVQQWAVPEETLVRTTAVGPPAPPLEPPGPPLVPPDDDPTGRRLDRSIAIGLTVLLVLVLGGVAAALLLTHHGKDAATTTAQSTGGSVPASTAAVPVTNAKAVVPDVVGAQRAAAEARIRALGLEPRTRTAPGSKPIGIVVTETPAAGSGLRRGSPVLLVVSSGPPAASVPDVVGLSAGDAADKLAQSGLKASSHETTSRRRAGTVVSQSPAAGAHAARGSTIALAVSKGAPTVTVPDLVGQSRSQANRALRKAGLQPRTFIVPSTQKPGTVVAQHPDAGSTAVQGSFVRVNVARAVPTGGSPGTTTTPTTTTATTPTQADVPDVTGLDEQEATQQLEDAGFQVDSTDEPVTDQSEDGTVLDEDPQGGSQADPGSTIAITVGRFAG